MSDWPTVAICIITFDRLREIKQTIAALHAHLHYIGPLQWHLADDSSPGSYVGDIMNAYPDLHFSFTKTDRKGWGANANKALGFLDKHPYVFLIEDDYVCIRDLDITAGVALMEKNEKIAAVRYDGVAAHSLTLHLEEVESRIGRFSYMRIAKDSPHLNVYSNRPHLRHRRFHECFGWYPEGITLGETETHFAHRVKDKKHCADIAILWDGLPTAFDHIGVSRQGSDQDNETVKK